MKVDFQVYIENHGNRYYKDKAILEPNSGHVFSNWTKSARVELTGDRIVVDWIMGLIDKEMGKETGTDDL